MVSHSFDSGSRETGESALTAVGPVSVVATTSFAIALSWLPSVTAGHTKRVTTNAIMLIAYCVGYASGQFMWRAEYAPR